MRQRNKWRTGHLTPDVILNLRFDYFNKRGSRKVLAQKYNITESTCALIITGQTYKNVGGPIHTPKATFTRDQYIESRHFSSAASCKEAGMIRVGICPDRCSPFRWKEPVAFVWRTTIPPGISSVRSARGPSCGRAFTPGDLPFLNWRTTVQITKNFNSSEFDCRDGSETPLEYRSHIETLAVQLQQLRAIWDLPIKIVSGWRSESYNESVDGAPRSQHLVGRAADIQVPGIPPGEVAAAIDNFMTQGKWVMGGLGLYATFVHFDTRGTRKRWGF